MSERPRQPQGHVAAARARGEADAMRRFLGELDEVALLSERELTVVTPYNQGVVKAA